MCLFYAELCIYYIVYIPAGRAHCVSRSCSLQLCTYTLISTLKCNVWLLSVVLKNTIYIERRNKLISFCGDVWFVKYLPRPITAPRDTTQHTHIYQKNRRKYDVFIRTLRGSHKNLLLLSLSRFSFLFACSFVIIFFHLL